MKKDVYVYTIGNSAYINLTNRCTNACEFCIRTYADGVEGYDLWLDKEPDADEIIELLPDVSTLDEVVFCGFGEPLIKFDVLMTVARFVRRNGGTTRINTNGQAELFLKDKDVAKRLSECIDKVSISLNETNAKDYDNICHSKYGLEAYDALITFAKHCVDVGIDVTMSVMETIGEEKIKLCKETAERIGAKLRVRTMI